MSRVKTTYDVFNAIGEPRRRALIEKLAQKEMSVNELTKIMQWPQPTVSKHLSVLKEVRIVSERKVGLGFIVFNPKNCGRFRNGCTSSKNIGVALWTNSNTIWKIFSLKEIRMNNTKVIPSEITREFDAPRQLVFDAWTQAQHLNNWMFPMQGCTCEFVKADISDNGDRFIFPHGI